MADDVIQYGVRDRIATIRIDDGKANAVSPALVASLSGALDRAEQDSDVGAVAIFGRPKRFSAGFDLEIMSKGSAQDRFELVRDGGRLALRVYGFPKPVVMGCTGHAMALGAILLLAGDRRIGADGSFKLALNEVAIGMTLPEFGLELARERMSKRHLQSAVGMARVYDPAGAADAGYLDRVVAPEELETAVLAEAAELGALSGSAFAATKKRLRGETIEAVSSRLDADVGALMGIR